MGTVKFKSFEEYGEYIKQTSDDMSVADDIKKFNKNAIEKNERPSQIIKNKKSLQRKRQSTAAIHRKGNK